MRQTPLVSIIIPSHNNADTLERALRSALAQTVPAEIIVTDDGSQDGTREVLGMYSHEIFRGRIVTSFHNRLGVACNKNHGAAIAKSPWLAFLDADDEYLPDHLAVRMSMVETDPRIDAFYGTMEIIGSPWVPDKDDPSRMIHIHDTSMGSSLVIQKRAFDLLGGYRNIDYGEDGDLLERARKRGMDIRLCHHQTYRYHRREGSITSLVQMQASAA